MRHDFAPYVRQRRPGEVLAPLGLDVPPHDNKWLPHFGYPIDSSREPTEQRQRSSGQGEI